MNSQHLANIKGRILDLGKKRSESSFSQDDFFHSRTFEYALGSVIFLYCFAGWGYIAVFTKVLTIYKIYLT
jgi:hypothetical protein